jgi:hypothetical protein
VSDQPDAKKIGGLLRVCLVVFALVLLGIVAWVVAAVLLGIVTGGASNFGVQGHTRSVGGIVLLALCVYLLLGSAWLRSLVRAIQAWTSAAARRVR